MTEAEWLACNDLVPALELLTARANDRKLRLFATICCGWVTQLGTSTPLLNTLDVAERFADGLATADELADAQEASSEVYQECERALSVSASYAVLAGTAGQGDDPTLTKLRDAAEIVYLTADAFISGDDLAYTARYCAKTYFHADPVAWLRDVFGNPFRPVVFAPEWRTDTAVTLARQMYESREFGAMPILADALQDAGCDSADVLDHCRGPGPHVRGCWVCDLVLGKK